MAEKNPHTPGTPEWQAWLDAKIAEHDDDPDIVARDTQQELERHQRVRDQLSE